MVDTLTPNLKLTNQTEGGNDNTWGTKADDNFEQIDDKFGDITSVSTTGGTTTLTDEQELINAVHVSGVLVSNATIVFSGRGGAWIVRNSTTGNFTVTAKVSGQTGVTVSQGDLRLVYCNGTDIAYATGSTDLLNDTTPQLGGDLDANGHNIGFDDATGITDDSGNEQVRFQKTASAINQIDITNAAIGTSPRIDATGDDTNIDLTLAGKGTGGLVGVFKSGTGLGLYDSDSSHALQLKTSENLSATKQLDLKVNGADRTIDLSGNLTVQGAATVPAGTSLVGANNLTDVGNAATAFGNIKQAASSSATGVVEIADQSEMEAASDTLRPVTPGRQHFHPGHPKAGGQFNGTGTPGFASGDYGMGAITDGGTGIFTLALDTAFNDTNYWINAWGRGVDADAGDCIVGGISAGTKTASSFQVRTSNSASSRIDSSEVGVNFWGDYA